jgi:Predicted ATP-dependent endonuclease of the OLD family
MKLIAVQVKNFRCINDSQEFQVGDVTCLVGKNESGKTSVLKALERVNSTDAAVRRKFDRERDWPRNRYDEYDPGATAVRTHWEIEPTDRTALEQVLGVGALKQTSFWDTLSYDGGGFCEVSLDATAVRQHLYYAAGLDETERGQLDAEPALEKLAAYITTQKLQTSPRVQNLLTKLQSFRDQNPDLAAIDLLTERMPKILYFDSYDKMSGKVPLNRLKGDIQNKRVSRTDTIFLMFLEYAGSTLDELSNIKKAETLFAKFEGVSNTITAKIFKYWRQNRHLEVKFTQNPSLPDDPPPLNEGTVFHTRIYNRLHGVTVEFDDRSAGFTWFFSFLIQFSLVKKKHGNVIILLDEPGLNLHGRAQADLLRFINEQLKPNHQVIYTTHSPFMVPANNLAAVRTVEDVLIEGKDEEPPELLGTKVGFDILKTDRDTVFPLQGALGYEIAQSLFISPNTLLVEGPSDILYLQIASHELQRRKREGLNSQWTLCPSGGVDKVSAFISLFSGNKLNIAVLTDYAHGQKGKVEGLKKSDILAKGRVFTAADFAGQPEADIEDLLGTELYVELVNAMYGLAGTAQISVAALPTISGRIVARVEDYLRPKTDLAPFTHYAPANWLLQNPGFLQRDTPPVTAALGRFERFFKQVNPLLAVS